MIEAVGDSFLQCPAQAEHQELMCFPDCIDQPGGSCHPANLHPACHFLYKPCKECWMPVPRLVLILTFHPVKEKVLPAEPIRMARSVMPGSCLSEKCSAPPKTRCS